MTKTIQVSPEFYSWIQSRSVPLEDNTVTACDKVMRELAGGMAAPLPTSRIDSGGRPKLNADALRRLGVGCFIVNGQVATWEGNRVHPRAYLDACVDGGSQLTYYERHNPRGDAASRVIIKAGLVDHSSEVVLMSGERMPMSALINRFLAGKI